MPITDLPRKTYPAHAFDARLQEGDTADHLIWQDPDRVSGAPCFRDTRVPIRILWDHLESGVPLDEFLEGFEGVTPEQARGVLRLAFAKLMEEQPFCP